jgi:hypothetical protein
MVGVSGRMGNAMRLTTHHLAAGLSVLLGLATSARAGPPTDDWGRVGTTKDCQDNCRTFLVNFVILTPVPFADADAKMQAEIDILNRYFRTRQGYQLFQFEKKRVIPYAQVQDISACPKLRALGHLDHKLDTGENDGEKRAAIEECFASFDSDARKLFDHHAINFYVFDNGGGRGSTGGAHRTPTERWPYLMVDHERLGHVQAVEEHEMGHALGGLEHVCVVDVGAKAATPIMATPHNWAGSSASCRASGGQTGDRSLGFSDDTASYRERPHREITQLLAEADKVQRALGTEGSPPPSSPPQW